MPVFPLTGRVSTVGPGVRGRRHANAHNFPDPPAPVIPAANNLLWAWNRQDVSQFEAAASGLHVFTGATLSVVADATLPGGNKLRIVGSPAGGGTVSWLALTPLVFTGTDRTVEFRYTVAGLSGEYGGICFLAEVSGGNLFGHSDVNGVAGWRNRWDAGVNVEDGSTIRTLHTVGAGLGVTSHCKVRIVGDKPAGAAPRFIVAGESAVQHTQQNKAWNWDDPPWAAYPASWNNLTLNRFGITLKAGAGAPTFDLLEFEVWSGGNADVSV